MVSCIWWKDNLKGLYSVCFFIWIFHLYLHFFSTCMLFLKKSLLDHRREARWDTASTYSHTFFFLSCCFGWAQLYRLWFDTQLISQTLALQWLNIFLTKTTNLIVELCLQEHSHCIWIAKIQVTTTLRLKETKSLINCSSGRKMEINNLFWRKSILNKQHFRIYFV